MPRSFSAVALLVPISVVGLSACSGQNTAAVERVTHFYQAITNHDAVGACADLAEQAIETLERNEGQSCETVIFNLGLTAPDQKPVSHVFGSATHVAYDNETVFLSRFAAGWKIIAAGCKPTTTNIPHHCTIEMS